MIKDPYIRSFDSFSAMGEYAKEVEDYELTSMKKVVDEFKSMVPRYIEQIKAAVVDQAEAQVLFSTANKAKGLEFPKVKLADDFPSLVEEKKIIAPTELEADEFNLIYVACTRAMDHLTVAKGGGLEEFIVQYQENKKAA